MTCGPYLECLGVGNDAAGAIAGALATHVGAAAALSDDRAVAASGDHARFIDSAVHTEELGDLLHHAWGRRNVLVSFLF